MTPLNPFTVPTPRASLARTHVMGSLPVVETLEMVIGANDAGAFGNVKMMLKVHCSVSLRCVLCCVLGLRSPQQQSEYLVGELRRASQVCNNFCRRLYARKVHNTRIEALLRRTEGCFVVK